MAKHLYKIWTANRMKKISVVVQKDSPQLYFDIILKASEKLQIDGSKLVFECDGTEIDDDSIELISTETLIILQKDEIWQPYLPHLLTESSSTISVTSNDDILAFDAIIHNEESNENELPTFTSNAFSEDFWHNYNIPFHKLNEDLQTELNANIKNKKIINMTVDFVISEVRKIKEIIPSKCIQILARKIVDKYPRTFKDYDDDGIVLGDGTSSLFHKLLHRNNYLNRPHKRSLSTSPAHSNIKSRKIMASNRAGCSNWQPAENIGTEEMIETTKKKLQITVQKINDLEEGEKLCIIDDLESTYPAQRKFLNDKPPTIQEIKHEWPILLETPYLFWHYQKLMGHSVQILSEHLKLKKKKILEFGILNKLTGITEEIEDDQKMSIEIIRIIIKYFKENGSYFFIMCEEGINLTEAKVETTSPCIVSFDQEKRYYTFVEGVNINNGSTSFYDVLQEMFAMYFVCNMAYPKEISNTLEFIQRYFLKIHPDSGSKSKLAKVSKCKVLNLINKLGKI